MPRYKITFETVAVLTIPELDLLAEEVKASVEDLTDEDTFAEAKYD